MKRFITSTVLSVFLLSGVAHADLSDGLVAQYLFNGNANDTSENGNNGTAYGTSLTVDRFGNVNSAYNFDGVDDWISLEGMNSADFSFDSFTLSVWFQTESNKLQSLIQSTDGITWGLTGYSSS